ncbi:MAG: transposase [Bdellovibrionota bacterium]
MSARKSATQLALVSTWKKDRYAFGGSLLRNSHAKTKRPFSKKLAVHLVLRSSHATGPRSLLRQGRRVDEILIEEARKQNLKLHGAANAGNHLHLLVQAPSRDHLNAFLRAVSSRISMLVTGARKGTPQTQALSKHAAASARFWDQRPFSRLVSVGRDFMNTLAYISLNSTESAGFSRSSARAMFREIRERFARGEITRSPGLAAAGFV